MALDCSPVEMNGSIDHSRSVMRSMMRSTMGEHEDRCDSCQLCHWNRDIVTAQTANCCCTRWTVQAADWLKAHDCTLQRVHVAPTSSPHRPLGYGSYFRARACTAVSPDMQELLPCRRLQSMRSGREIPHHIWAQKTFNKSRCGESQDHT